MTARQEQSRLGRLVLTLENATTPIFVFATVNAVLCWAAAWLFKDTYEFSAALLGLGGLPIVVAVCAYLLVLVNRVEGG
jgi:hypothetical protein